MRHRRLFAPLALILAATLVLSGCESSKKKAERYYLSGMELLEAGDVDRALVQFRNVFKYDGFHKDARRAYADTERKLGNKSEAYSQYLRLIEQYPDTADVRLILAEMAILDGQWTEAERHGREALRLAPDAPGAGAVGAALDYRAGALAGDDEAMEKAALAARDALADDPDNEVALRITIDWEARVGETAAALAQVDHALDLDPDSMPLNLQKLRLLAQQGDSDEVGAQLREMVARFPESTEIRDALIGWFASRRDVDGAEEFLRQQAGDPTGPVEGYTNLIRFLQAARGVDAAKDEIDTLVAANKGTPNEGYYRAMAAAVAFAEGDSADAITALETILRDAPQGDQARRIKVMLAQMLEATGNRVGARARIEEVLAEDPAQVAALKMRARWLIGEDKPDAAILDLRTALGQSPRDAALLTSLAQAYERAGSLDLAGEQLALAVEASGSAPDESLRYARFLIRQGRAKAADTVLTDSRRVHPTDIGVLSALGRLAAQDADWERVADIVATLRRIDSPRSRTAAVELEAARLQAQGQEDESIASLEELAASGDDPAAPARLVQAYAQAGELAKARAYVDSLRQERPEDPGLLVLSGNLHAVSGEIDAAEADFRAALDRDPAADQAAQQLYGLLLASGRADEAGALLDQALAASPGSVGLRWFKASELQAAGDIDGAIALYEALYAEDSGNLLAANNLASLLSSFRDDADSLARATAIARRLKDTKEPALQDTYGWIAHLNGDNDEALRYLEPSAKAQAGDALTQLHLGLTYLALGRTEDARRQLALALDLAGDSQLPPFQLAREELARLDAPPSQP